MHDFGTLIWAIVIIIGVISSMVSNARKRAASDAGAEPAPQAVADRAIDAMPAPARRSVRPVARSAPPVAAKPARPQPPLPEVLPHDPFHTPPGGRRAAFFVDRASARHAIIAAEVLGPPVALRPQRETNGSAW